MQQIYETGANSAAANNLVLSVLNDGAVYKDRLHIGFAMLQGASHRGLTFRKLADYEATAQRAGGAKFKAAEITEAGKLIERETLRHCLEIIRDEWNGAPISATVRRWHDSINGNSYFSARLEIPKDDGKFGMPWISFRSIIIPFQYGYGTAPEWAVTKACEEIGLFVRGNKVLSELPLRITDKGWLRKCDMFHSKISKFSY